MDTILVELKHEKALQLLQDLEAMEIISISLNTPETVQSLSSRFKGILSQNDAEDLNKHISQMREEWNGF